MYQRLFFETLEARFVLEAEKGGEGLARKRGFYPRAHLAQNVVLIGFINASFCGHNELKKKRAPRSGKRLRNNVERQKAKIRKSGGKSKAKGVIRKRQ
jgi:hypothetical protein